ncbi:MAG: NUDIX domain-containing protein [Candidatus Latescibacteria bacterium]|jgi:8-oxo-dGTP diphosphatase|nr:NUDIX domain-containing protein [Candidatus Latescibacterota bacterium]
MGNTDMLIGILPVAGEETLMHPITHSVPKALIEVNGICLLERAINNLKTIGVDKIIVVTGSLIKSIRDFLNVQKFDVSIELVSQEKRLGLSHAIAISSEYITGDFVLFCPDAIYTNTDDYFEAKYFFLKYRPTALLTAIVAPPGRKNRSKYYSGKLRNPEPNLFDNISNDYDATGLPMVSAGITFFSLSSLKYLPTLNNTTKEYDFTLFLSSIMTKDSFMVYLLRGGMYDFAKPEDIDYYEHLQEKLSRTQGMGVSIILINRKGEVLLQLRDDIPKIRYPAYWALFGGSIDCGETPYEAIKREIKEEINYELINFGLFREFIQNNKREFAFVGILDAEINDLTLNEGQDMRFFKPSQISSCKIRPDDRKTLKLYFREYFNE